jgi:tRNA pseudouridine38-40 synthase
MHFFKLTLAYDGTNFHGWQRQPGQPTIQGALSEVAQKLTGEQVFFTAAGRTDAGVHAVGQVVHFRTRSELTAQEFQRAFNALLPPDIRVLAAEEVGPDFHARWNAAAKIYQYRIFRGRVVPPFLWRYALHYPFPLDEEAMRRAAGLFEGEHDFTSFAASTGSEEDDAERLMTRVILASRLERRNAHPWPWPASLSASPEANTQCDSNSSAYELIYTVHGRSFLRYMVRKMVGTLLEVGRGRLAVEDVPKLFDLRDRSRSGPTVPPHGLCLLRVEYEEKVRS